MRRLLVTAAGMLAIVLVAMAFAYTFQSNDIPVGEPTVVSWPDVATPTPAAVSLADVTTTPKESAGTAPGNVDSR